MKVQARQEAPEHPVFEVTEVRNAFDLDELVRWLHSRDLPEDMSISLWGSLIRFRRRTDRDYYAMGLTMALHPDWES
jgi:hypothetical protein